MDITAPICQTLNTEKANMLLYDTSGMEVWIMENNPEFANRIIKQLKAYAKTLGSNTDFDSYKAAYGTMQPHAATHHAIQQTYINGHFAMLISLALSQKFLVSFVIFLFITKTF